MPKESPQLASWGAPRDSVSSLPPCKRYIITHNEAGKSVVHSAPAHRWRGDPEVGGVARSYATQGFPINASGDVDVAGYLSETGDTSHLGTTIVNTNGMNVNVIEMAPSATSQFHRTLSLDIVTVTSGHLRLQLDSGQVIDLYPGDHVVQRGTMHKWSNPSTTEPTRFIGVIVPIREFEIPGGRGMAREEHVQGSEGVDFEVGRL